MSIAISIHTQKTPEKKVNRWYVLYVKSKQEVIIQNYINESVVDMEAYSPTHVVTKQWKDRKKKVITPLLPKIVLVKTQDNLRDKVFQIPGTVRYLFELRKTAIVREIEIEQLRAITDNSRVIDHEITSIVKGTEIDLTPYGFKDLKGIVDNVSNTVCWVTLKTLSCTLKLKLKKRK
jgi:transcription antitermination factor NusG